MSIHRSLKTNRFGAKRNVRKRYERLQKLVRNDKFVDKLGVFGLPKEKINASRLKLRKEVEEGFDEDS